MHYSKVKITLDEDVPHHDKEVFIDVAGDPWPLAKALQKGNFKVTVIETELVKKETELS